MLGRYIAITLMGLGGAMLLAPDGRTSHNQASAVEATRMSVDPVQNLAPAAIRSDDTDAVETAAQTSREDQIKANPVLRLVTTGADATPERVPTEESSRVDDAEVAGAKTEPALPLASALEAAVRESAVPTLQEPGSIEAASVSAETLALISIAEGRTQLPARQEARIEIEPTWLYVTGSRVNVRAGPSTDFGVIGSVSFGDAVELVDDAGDGWAEIRVSGGGTGYMARRFLGE
ncbi:MAG: SH3 domain-containing protein [Pseudomonadota bacterium]